MAKELPPQDDQRTRSERVFWWMEHYAALLGTESEPSVPVITGVPTISGDTGLGDTLTATPAPVAAYPAPTTVLQWTRDGSDIPGALGTTYTIVEDDQPSDIRVRQTSTNSEGSDTATSDATAIPSGANPAYQILIKTDNAGTSSSTQFTLPATGTYDVDWGDGNTQTGLTGSQTHTYSSAGNYVIKVTGGLTAITFNNGDDKLKLLEIQNWGDPTWSTFANAYFGCSNLQITASDLPNSGSVTNFSAAWYNCSSLTSFPLIDTSSGINFYAAWQGCSGLTSFPLVDTSSGTNFSASWYSCTGLTSFPLIDTSSGTDFSYTWQNCTSLTSFPLLDTSSGTNFSSAWRICTSLTSFPLIDTSSGTNFSYAWYNCSSLTSFPLIDTSSGINFSYAWYDCSSLTSFPLIDTSSGTNFSASWYSCTGLTSFPLIDTSSGTDFSYTWQNCTSLTSFAELSFASMSTGNNCFLGSTLPTATWSNILIATEAANSNSSVNFHGGNSKYSAGAAATARAALIADHSWTITDGGPA